MTRIALALPRVLRTYPLRSRARSRSSAALGEIPNLAPISLTEGATSSRSLYRSMKYRTSCCFGDNRFIIFSVKDPIKYYSTV